ncbi:hypothetical protein A4E84_36970 [Streptomyces qaidamensis]|uniref:DUF2238 domain-containing protein n=1 Tax=Streptomyces qaidamensis TaxID=1783515 RepID=A0A143CBX4_9ACTN|nr:hypothetical protein A4E84_36970 [Streptomyces qaidamensis]
MTWSALLMLAGSALVAVVVLSHLAALRFLLAIVLLLAVIALRVPHAYEAAFSLVVVGAMWCDVGEIYRRVAELDALVHFLLTATGSVVAFFALLRIGGPPLWDAAAEARWWVIVVLVGMAGTVGAVLWEMYEWVVERIAPGSMRVGYTDTLADVAVGMVGALLAGLVFSLVSRDTLAGGAGARASEERRPS